MELFADVKMAGFAEFYLLTFYCWILLQRNRTNGILFASMYLVRY